MLSKTAIYLTLTNNYYNNESQLCFIPFHNSRKYTLNNYLTLKLTSSHPKAFLSVYFDKILL